jgi:nucleoside-diphosphate-sugar epimerase
VVKRILDEKPVIIHGDGTSLWTLTHAKDFAKGFVGLMANPHALGQAFHITTDESMTWNQIYETVADEAGKPLHALHVASDFLAENGGSYDLRGELLGDKTYSVVFYNSKVKRLVPEFICTTSMADGLRECTRHILSHTELQTEDAAFDRWCDAIVRAMNAAEKALM